MFKECERSGRFQCNIQPRDTKVFDRQRTSISRASATARNTPRAMVKKSCQAATSSATTSVCALLPLFFLFAASRSRFFFASRFAIASAASFRASSVDFTCFFFPYASGAIKEGRYDFLFGAGGGRYGFSAGSVAGAAAGAAADLAAAGGAAEGVAPGAGSRAGAGSSAAGAFARGPSGFPPVGTAGATSMTTVFADDDACAMAWATSTSAARARGHRHWCQPR